MIVYIKANPHLRFSHTYFSEYEYIYSKNDGFIYDEDGNLFETFDDTDFMHIGLRLREGGNWEDGWYVKGCRYSLEIPTVGLCCEAYYLSKRKDGKEWMHFPFCSEENCPLKHPELLEGATLEDEE
jgi:hypothetical protein